MGDGQTIWRKHGFEVDTAGWPVVLVHYPADPKLESYRALFERYATLASRGELIAWLVDMTAFNPVGVSAANRRAAADTFAQYHQALAAVTICEARVISNPVARGVVTAFDWLTGSKWPCANFGSLRDARSWIEEQRRIAGA